MSNSRGSQRDGATLERIKDETGGMRNDRVIHQLLSNAERHLALSAGMGDVVGDCSAAKYHAGNLRGGNLKECGAAWAE